MSEMDPELASIAAELHEQADDLNDRIVEIDMSILATKYPNLTPAEITETQLETAEQQDAYAALRIVRYEAVYSNLLAYYNEITARQCLLNLGFSVAEIDEQAAGQVGATCDAPQNMMRHILATFTVSD